MPTDGTLFLENLPHSKQYLLTLLSVFFSLGAVLSSIVSYIFLPGESCRQYDGCDIAGKENDGWRKVLLVLGCFVSILSLSYDSCLTTESALLVRSVGSVPLARVPSVPRLEWPITRSCRRSPRNRLVQ